MATKNFPKIKPNATELERVFGPDINRKTKWTWEENKQRLKIPTAERYHYTSQFKNAKTRVHVPPAGCRYTLEFLSVL